MKLSYLIRNSIKLISLVFAAGRHPKSEDVVFLMYHRVSGDSGLELDIDAGIFEKQMEWLANSAIVVDVDTACARASNSENEFTSEGVKPRVVLTFDDAYEDFYTTVWPILKKYNLPAILYTPTLYIEEPSAVPLSRSLANIQFRPVTWGMLVELNACPLVTIGAHSHTHREFPTLSATEIGEEIRISDKIFEERLGFRPVHFAYPRGAWDERCELALGTRYQSTALVNGGVRNIYTLSESRLPRVPVLSSDGLWWFKHRVLGRLAFEEKALGMIRNIIQKRKAVR